MSLLVCQNVSFAYDGNEIISNINFSISKGDYLCIVGENGAGKSTLIKGLLGLKRQSSGKILTGDGLCQNEIGYLPQQNQIQKDFPASVYEVVLSGRLNSLGFRPFYRKVDKKTAISNMEKLDIVNLKNRCYRDLSGGQQQRVLLARALCATKRLLLLDEPISGLDPVMTSEFYELICKLNKEDKITIIMVSHDIHGALENATHVLHVGKSNSFFGDMQEYVNSSQGKKFLGGDTID